MKLRTRVAVLTGLAAAVAVVTVSAAAWFVARSQMRASVDDQLIERAEIVRSFPRGGGFGRGPGGRRPGFLEGGAIEQRFGSDGVILSVGEVTIPVSGADLAVVRGDRSTVLRDETVDGLHLRVLTFAIDTTAVDGGRDTTIAVTLAEPLTQVDDSLARLRGALVIVSVLGIAGAGAVSLIVAERSLRPVERLTIAAEHVAATQDLTSEIEVERHDELGSLAASFNRMLSALSRSRDQQQQLVTDASHELRTPLTSLRTNVELMQRAESADSDLRRQIMDDVLFELDELTLVVTELVELATDRREAGEFVSVDLAAVASSVVERHRRRSDASIQITASRSVVDAIPALIERAISNLVDNAVKFAGEDGTVTVEVASGRVVVADDGPGIAPTDRPHVFERFWRSDEAKAMPGSGLGLSIVKQVVDDHGGSISVEESPAGGAQFVLTLPESSQDDLP